MHYLLIFGSLLVQIHLFSAHLDWESFKSLHGKEYSSVVEAKLRKSIFMEKKRIVERHNAESANKLGFTMGLNHLSDLTSEELAHMNGYKVLPEGSLKNSLKSKIYFTRFISRAATIGIPEAIDWRKFPGRVSEVKNQGQCGSCWAFSATGALEGQMVEKAHKLSSLSEQNLIDCSIQNQGCSGGNMYYAWQDINVEGGIEDEQNYPYLGYKEECLFNRTRSVFNSKEGYVLPPGDEETLKITVGIFGPVSVAIDASHPSFLCYESGIYYEPRCKTYIHDHSVLIVGYGTEPDLGDYWIVKNSWGKNWGEEGYIRIARNKRNHCGIASMAMIPSFDEESSNLE